MREATILCRLNENGKEFEVLDKKPSSPHGFELVFGSLARQTLAAVNLEHADYLVGHDFRRAWVSSPSSSGPRGPVALSVSTNATFFTSAIFFVAKGGVACHHLLARLRNQRQTAAGQPPSSAEKVVVTVAFCHGA